MPDKTKMGQLHVVFLAELTKSRVTPGSGNQWADPIDSRGNRLEQVFAWAVEGKSTLGESISFSRPLMDKAREQAGGERPLIGLRFYAHERLDLVDDDWVAITADDFAELLEKATHSLYVIERGLQLPAQWSEEEVAALRRDFEAAVASGHKLQVMPLQVVSQDPTEDDGDAPALISSLREEIAELSRRPTLDQHRETVNQVAKLSAELEHYRAQAERLAALVNEAPDLAEVDAMRQELATVQANDRYKADVIAALHRQIEQVMHIREPDDTVGPGINPVATVVDAGNPPPQLPWLMVWETHLGSMVTHSAIRYDNQGHMSTIRVDSVRVENGAHGETRLIVNEQIVRAGELFVNGQSRCKVGA